ncbi:hypothetical protein E2C01_020012 [Portunus trituberculatus]|uniref:CCDC66 domain-containing protein n=1 Tax=Portunus trituberculatus TaxID=210409 RepID=A0A5B7DYX2_PORTR|nr:hypothetical protein [Portunus trituberculatus]
MNCLKGPLRRRRGLVLVAWLVCSTIPGIRVCSTCPSFLSFPQAPDSTPPSAASSQGSVASRWSTASGGNHSDDRSAGRARWGDRGVGVGHLWAPGEDTVPGSRGGDSLPPAWAEKEEENVLPGAPYSKPEQRTYARGGGMHRMDPEESAERERRKKQAEETQRIIRQQLEEKKRQKAVEEERERREAAIWEERVREQQEREARELQEEIRKKKEKEVKVSSDNFPHFTPVSILSPKY